MNSLKFKRKEKIGWLRECFEDGYSLRATARRVGVTRQTVSRYFKLMAAKGIIRGCCGCGQPAGHVGWCSTRVSESPRRRAHLRRWHGKGNDIDLGVLRSKDPEFVDRTFRARKRKGSGSRKTAEGSANQ